MAGGIFLGVKEKMQCRNVVNKTSAYSVLVTDEQINFTGSSAATFTLPDLSTTVGTTSGGSKEFYFVNNGTAVLTLSSFSSSQTIGGFTSISLQPGETIVVESNTKRTDWIIDDPYPSSVGVDFQMTLVANTNGTTAVNVFSVPLAPDNFTIKDVTLTALDTTTGNISVSNNGNTVVSIAKGATSGALVGGTTLSNTQVVAGTALTVVSDSAGNARVRIVISSKTAISNRY